MADPPKGIAGWFQTRLPLNVSELLTAAGSEPVPGHLKKWWFGLGGTAAILFLVQVVTGILLSFYYVPNPDAAYESVQHITEEVPFGWYIRSIHKWSAHGMVAAVMLHAIRVFFTGAYRSPRELNWCIGGVILIVTMVFGFTGYSLVYEQLSYWGATVAGNLTAAAPLVGPALANFIRGGETITANTLTRFHVLHIGVLPTVMFALLAAHFLLIRVHGVSELRFKKDTEKDAGSFPFFPDHFLTEVMLGVILLILITCLALIFPAGLEEKADPLVTPEHIKPEWYFYWTFRWLKLVGLQTAVLSLGAAAAVFIGWPFIDGFLRRRNPKSELSVWLGILAVIGLCIMTVWEAWVLAH